jgi:D-xylono/L-arabinono-1,4-lactonase
MNHTSFNPNSRRLSRRDVLKLAAIGALAGCTRPLAPAAIPSATPTLAPAPTHTPASTLVPTPALVPTPGSAAPELIADYACVTGEGPLWHPDEQRVYWVDIPKGRLFRYTPATGEHEQCFESQEALGGFTIQEDGALLLFMARGAVKLWRGGEARADATTTVIDEIPDEGATRFNDVIADPEGRVFCGTMPTQSRLGRLYRLDPDRTLTKLLDGIGVSNGLGFTPDLKSLYYTDSPTRNIYIFDYDRATGDLSNRRVFVQTPDGEGVPDGLTVDADGYVWSGRWDGGVLVRYTPDGAEERRIAFPARKVSSVTFGGPDYTDIYVTTAGGDQKAREGDGAGALFRLRLGIQGKAEFRSRIGDG